MLSQPPLWEWVRFIAVHGCVRPCFLFTLCGVFSLYSSVSTGADTGTGDAGVNADSDTEQQIGFNSIRSVEGELAETAERQRAGSLETFRAGKQALEDRLGLAYGFDNFSQYLGTDSDQSPADAASNVTRLYGVWTAVGRGTPDDGALIFKVEHRMALGSKISTQALGPSLGYAGLFAAAYSDAGTVLTNLFWRQRFAGGRGSLVIGQVDATDYVNVNSLASPWTAFTNLEFQQQSTLPAPAQGLGAAVLWRLNANWGLLAGFADANADPSDPWESAKDFVDTRETFKHIAVGWSPDWGDRVDQLIQLTVWQVDERDEAGVEDGQGVALTASGRRDNWRPFIRVGYAKDGGAVLDRSISLGTGYDIRSGKDLIGLGLNWGRAPDDSRDQYTVEAFYRYDMTDFLQLTPQIQYVIDPANDPDTDSILVWGVRLRGFF